MQSKTFSTLIRVILLFSLLAACTSTTAPTQQAPTPQAPAATQAPTQIAVQATATEFIMPTDEPTLAPTATEIEPTSEPSGMTTDLSFTDSLGRSVTLHGGTAQKIVSLAPSNTEILFAVGAGSQVVGRDMFSDFPAEAQKLPDVGGGFGELNTETIVALQPDLVLASELSPPEQIAALEDLGLTVFALGNPKDFDDLYANLILVGQLTGHQPEARRLNESLQARVQAVQEKLANVQERPLVFYELDSTDPNAPYTAGPGTFIDMLITMAGGKNVGQILGSDWGQVSIENLLVENPDMILLGDATWGGVKPEDVAARESWQGLKAVQNGSIFTFDDNLVSRPGPRLIDGLEALARQFHPELFE